MVKLFSVVASVATTLAVASASNNMTSNAVKPLAGEPLDTMVFCGIDLVVSDLWSARVSNPDGCIAPCTPESGCNAVTWTNYEGGTCWFKHVDDVWEQSVPRASSVSFVRMYWGRPLMANLRPTYDVDMPGNDIGSVAEPEPTFCVNRCSDNPFCFASTWSSYNGGTCWLKSKASPYVHAVGVRAEYFGRATNPYTCLVNP